MSWVKWIPIIIAKAPYVLIFGVELIEAGVCSINFIGKYVVGLLKGAVVPCTEKEEATDKLVKEWKDVGHSFKNIFTA